MNDHKTIEELEELSPQELHDMLYSCLTEIDDKIKDFSFLQRIIFCIDSDVNNITFENGASCLHIAAHNCNVKICKFLLKLGANINACDISDLTPLHYAMNESLHIWNLDLIPVIAKFRYPPMVKFLIKKGAYLDAKDISGRTPLHICATNLSWLQISKGVINYLLKAGASKDVLDNKGNTPWNAASDYVRGYIPELNPNA